MVGLFSQASGIIISIACGSERPPRCSSSTTSSKEAESDASGVQIGNSRSRSPGMTSRAQQRLSGPHPVAVALDGVDLAVVGDHPERVGQLPGGEGVGGEPGVHDDQRTGHPLVEQLGEHQLQLLGGQHALVDQGAAGQRGEVDPGLVLGPPAQAVGQPVQGDPPAAARPWPRRTAARSSGMFARVRSLRRGVVGPHARASPGRSGAPRRRSARSSPWPWPPRRARWAGTRCRPRTRLAAAGRIRPRRAGTRPGSASGCPHRHRSSGPRRWPPGGPGCAAPPGPGRMMSWLGDAGQGGHEGDPAGVVLERRVVQALARARAGKGTSSGHQRTPVVKPVGT